jgi:hypothetical protein
MSIFNKRPVNPETLSLHPVEGLNLAEQLKHGIHISSSAGLQKQLERELPDVKNAYRDPAHAYRRLKFVGENSRARGLWATVISAQGVGIGMATLQRNRLVPQIIPNDRISTIEMSYWHRPVDPETDVAIGNIVVSRLLGEQKRIFPYVEGVWSVALLDDTIKNEVLSDMNMLAVGDPQEFTIGDSVTEPRQLWTLETEQAGPRDKVSSLSR